MEKSSVRSMEINCDILRANCLYICARIWIINRRRPNIDCAFASHKPDGMRMKDITFKGSNVALYVKKLCASETISLNTTVMLQALE